MGDQRLDHAKELYEQAVFAGDADAVAAAHDELDSVEADLALARGRILHARFLADRQEDPHELALFEQAVELYRRLGEVRGEAEACFWVGTFHQVVRGDGDTALPALERSYALAQQAGDPLTRSYAVRHLGFHAMEQGRLDVARDRLEESLRLRRELGFRPGVAAALLALAELAAESGERERARTLLAEATAEAEGSGARGTLRWIDAARAELAATE
jgi:tetratricopeptide (TPR) repeat protein